MDPQHIARNADAWTGDVRTEVRKALDILYVAGDVVELRGLDAEIRPGFKRTISGYYDDFDQLAEDAAELSGKCAGVYITMNPVVPDLLARRCNRFDVAMRGESTTDDQIVKRRWMLIDLDPVRPSGISSTQAELERALERAYEVRSWMWESDWPRPVMACSGNGVHLLLKIDMPADDGGAVSAMLADIASRFPADETNVGIDITVSNAARIVRCYGTAAMKGDSLPERPQRYSYIFEVPRE